MDTVTEVKYLGVKIDETLSGEGILDTVVKKCTGRIKFLYRQAGCLPAAIKKTLCQALRFVLDLEHRTHLTIDHVTELNMLSIPEREPNS